jgi:hypothetical protein
MNLFPLPIYMMTVTHSQERSSQSLFPCCTVWICKSFGWSSEYWAPTFLWRRTAFFLHCTHLVFPKVGCFKSNHPIQTPAYVMCPFCCGNVFTEALPSNSCLFWFWHGSFQQTCHNIHSAFKYKCHLFSDFPKFLFPYIFICYSLLIFGKIWLKLHCWFTYCNFEHMLSWITILLI